MFYKNDEERNSVEEIERRICDETFIRLNLGSFAKCRVYQTDKFVSRFKNFAADIATLTALYLYSMGDNAPAYNQFSYTS